MCKDNHGHGYDWKHNNQTIHVDVKCHEHPHKHQEREVKDEDLTEYIGVDSYDKMEFCKKEQMGQKCKTKGTMCQDAHFKWWDGKKGDKAKEWDKFACVTKKACGDNSGKGWTKKAKGGVLHIDVKCAKPGQEHHHEDHHHEGHHPHGHHEGHHPHGHKDHQHRHHE